MGAAAVPMLVGTGVQILGAKMGWDPRLTALAGIAAGGVGAGMASGAFAGGTAAATQVGTTGLAGASALSPSIATNAFNPATTGVLAGSQAGQAALASRMATSAGASTALMGGQGMMASSPYTPNPVQSVGVPQGYAPAGPGAGYYGSAPRPAIDSVAEVKAPFFNRTQPDGSQGLSPADSLGVSMLDTFLQYELALAKQPKPRPTRSGGGGGGGGGPAASYQGGGGSSGQKQVTWGFGGGNNNGYQPQGLV
jgi:uncharacterized membrane protein YgcG